MFAYVVIVAAFIAGYSALPERDLTDTFLHNAESFVDILRKEPDLLEFYRDKVTVLTEFKLSDEERAKAFKQEHLYFKGSKNIEVAQLAFEFAKARVIREYFDGRDKDGNAFMNDFLSLAISCEFIEGDHEFRRKKIIKLIAAHHPVKLSLDALKSRDLFSLEYSMFKPPL